MELNSIFICGIKNIRINSDFDSELVLTPGEKNSDIPKITLTSNKSIVKSLIGERLQYFIGAIEYNHLLTNYPLIVFARSKFDDSDADSINHLDSHLHFLKMYFFCLWLIKDNSCDFDIGFLYFIKGDAEFVSSNTISYGNFDCSGNTSDIEFTREELERAAMFLKDYIQVEYKLKPKLVSISAFDKIAIAHYFIQNARSVNDLGLKAVGYCSALETLFSNGDTTEMAHRLAERIAKFLEKDLEKRIDVYKSVKKVYDFRSKVTHGATYSKEQKIIELPSIVNQADEICRRVMQYGYAASEKESIFDKSKEDFDQFFIKLILE